MKEKKGNLSRRKVVRFGEGPLGFVIDGDERGRVFVKDFGSYDETGKIIQAQANAGIRIGDEIIAVNGNPVSSCWDFAHAVTACRPADITFLLEEEEEDEQLAQEETEDQEEEEEEAEDKENEEEKKEECYDFLFKITKQMYCCRTSYILLNS